MDFFGTTSATVMSLTLALGAAAAVSDVRKPEQPHPANEFGVAEATIDKWQCDGEPKITVTTVVGKWNSRDELPEVLVLDVRLKSRLRGNWEIWRIDLCETTPENTERTVESFQSVDNPQSRSHAREYMAGFRKGRYTYRVAISLHPQRRLSDAEIQSARRAVMEGQCIKISDATSIAL